MPSDYTKRRSRTLARKHRFDIINREDGTCAICGYAFWRALAVHHIRPVSQGGDGNKDNLMAVCANCHTVIHLLRRKAYNDTFVFSLFKFYGIPTAVKLIAVAFSNFAWIQEGKYWGIPREDELVNYLVKKFNGYKKEKGQRSPEYTFGYKLEAIMQEYISIKEEDKK